MPVLSTELRNKLEKVVVEARDVAEVGARVALESLAVHHYEPYAHMDDEQRKLRNRLRARGRQLGDVQEGARLEIRHLIGEVAYEHWHRMLFAQFLAENNLLIEPEMGIAITMDECEELARDACEDPRAMAARFAQDSLPQIFREGDPVLELALPLETQQALDRLLDSLSSEVFTADDSLGWTYQFWQSKRKDEVNASGKKIGADELPAVTQLFTEHYMVLFLYHNTIGAWHAGKVLAANPELARNAQSEQELRDAVRLKSHGGYDFEYLRFVPVPDVPEQSDAASEPLTGPWRPAAGTFEGWPKTAREITVLDPCCGSGHFLNEGFQLLVRLRVDEEGLGLENAIRAVLTDNLHGLEIDPRCTQIAAFNLALAAWKMIGKPSELPQLHIACSGLAVGATKGKWISLAGDDPRLRAGMGRLYDLFEQAPLLGSLIDPKALKGDMFEADFSELQPLLQEALEHERDDDEKAERAVAAQGMAKAAELLSSEYTLVITNVPYLARGKQDESLKRFADAFHKEARNDLATILIDRVPQCLVRHGTIGAISPQNWLTLTSYEVFRIRLLGDKTWNFIARLGPKCFQTPMFDFNVAMIVFTDSPPAQDMKIHGTDVTLLANAAAKEASLMDSRIIFATQKSQEATPDHRITLAEHEQSTLLREYARAFIGLHVGDWEAYRRGFWELSRLEALWRTLHNSTSGTHMYSGGENILYWPNEGQMHRENAAARVQGQPAWGHLGVCISLMADLPAALYGGGLFRNGVAAIVPKKPEYLPGIWTYCSSGDFHDQVRRIDQKLYVTCGTLTKVPFDLTHWQKVAAEKYPNGLPEPYSDDPTQWIFHGYPCGSVIWDEEKKWTAHGPLRVDATVLQVAVARILGYRWPAELDPEMRLADEAREWVTRCDELLEYADEDGIVCIPSIRGESPAAERLRTLLAAAFGEAWTPETERQLIAETGSNATDLDTWLRNDFFEQHCKLFHHRPFVWHVWDGRTRDGFHALVSYHKLAEGNGVGRRTLENLTYSYLGDWITRQEDGVRRGTAGSEDRLAAAMELRERLVAILEGEQPFDLFIRWKALVEQPIGWDPDINHGVRLNARPFLASDIPSGKKGAGIFRWKPNIKWDKDRGKEPQSLRPKDQYPWFWTWDEQTQDFLGNDKFDGNRWNNLHYTNDMKQKAREDATEDGH